MIFTNLIDGVIIAELEQIEDERGAILHMLRSDSPDFTHFGECYFSEIIPGYVKAWKCHLRQTQRVAVPIGRVHLVLYDDRIGSITKGSVYTVSLGRPDNYVRITIPPMVWYGFTCISDYPALLVNCTDIPHDPRECMKKSPDDPAMPYQWIFEHE